MESLKGKTMPDKINEKIDKWGFWALTTLIVLVGGMMKTSFTETQKDLASLSTQVTIITTKLENYENTQVAMKTEFKEMNARLSSIERRMDRYEAEVKSQQQYFDTANGK